MKLNNDKFINNSGWDLFQQLYVTIVTFVVGMISVRVLGPTNYGTIGIANAVLLFVAAFSWLGFDSIIINELVRNNDEEERVVGTVFFSKICFSTFFLVVSYFIVKKIYASEILCMVFIILSFSQILQAYEVFHWWLQKNLNTKTFSIINMITCSIVAVFQIYIIISHKSVFWFASVQTIQYALLFILLIYIYLIKYKKRLCVSFDIFKMLLSKGYHFIVSSISITVYMQIDKLMIGKMISENQAGCYNAAVNIAVLWQFIPLAIINAARPILFEHKLKNEEYFEYIYKRIMFFVFLMSLLFCVFISIFSKPIVLLLYGNKYIDAITPLRICTWATMIAMIGVMRSLWVLANDYNKYDKYFTLIAAVINIVLNYLGIKYIGIAGAALSTLISYFVEVHIVNSLFEDMKPFNRLFSESIFEFKESFRFALQYLRKLK